MSQPDRPDTPDDAPEELEEQAQIAIDAAVKLIRELGPTLEQIDAEYADGRHGITSMTAIDCSIFPKSFVAGVIDMHCHLMKVQALCRELEQQVARLTGANELLHQLVKTDQVARLEFNLNATRNAHRVLCAGIKSALGLDNWPEISGVFQEGVVRLLIDHVGRLTEQNSRLTAKIVELTVAADNDDEFHRIAEENARLTRELADRDATIKSVSTMLGWGNVPPLRSLELTIASWKQELDAAESENARLHAMLLESIRTEDIGFGNGRIARDPWTPASIAAELERREEGGT